jgi:Short repeat of unknown function (DUF308)
MVLRPVSTLGPCRLRLTSRSAHDHQWCKEVRIWIRLSRPALGFWPSGGRRRGVWGRRSCLAQHLASGPHSLFWCLCARLRSTVAGRGPQPARPPAHRLGAMHSGGLAGVAIGAVTFLRPGITALALVYLIAGWAIITGVFEVVAAVDLHSEVRSSWWLGITGVLSILFGALIGIQPGAGVLAILWVIGFYAILAGGPAIHQPQHGRVPPQQDLSQAGRQLAHTARSCHHIGGQAFSRRRSVTRPPLVTLMGTFWLSFPRQD